MALLGAVDMDACMWLNRDQLVRSKRIFARWTKGLK